MGKLWHRVWPLNIRAQMMLWYFLIFAILIFLFGAVFYFNLRTSLETNVDAELRLHARDIASGIHMENGVLDVEDVTGTLPGLADPDASRDSSGSDSTPPPSHATSAVEPDDTITPLVRIFNSHGAAIYLSPAYGTLALPSESITQPLANSEWEGTETTKTGLTVRVYSLPLQDNGKVYAVLQVGESLSSVFSTLRSAVIELLIIGLVVLLLSLIGSYWLAAHTFAPVEKMTSIARRIEAGDLHERVPVPRTQDELQTLALTFNDMIERLEKSFARQRRFVADASHELRTPVAAIRSMTDVTLARNQPVPEEEYITVLRDVNAESERLGHLISDLLALARSDEQQVLFERETVRLDLLVADVAATTELLATEKDITLVIEAAEPATVLGDEARLIQVIMNLIDNAINYTNAGGTVTLRVQTKDENVYLSVSDTGIGIAPDHLEHIFERFYRVDPARSRAAGSTGLGLAIVDWVVHAHDGEISVTSRVGQGTTFTVQLPLAPQSIEEN
ncbi:MAG TPA: HAMP domain-containing sensor histidine kinase [Ktedonobacteraceae bacterium]|nr:HAMP domain-containing sensor histidine kinase [Ktedonobacteraceae bacterium]